MKALNTKTRILSLCLSLILGFAGLGTMSAFRVTAEVEKKDGEADSLFDESKGYSETLYNNTNGLPTSEANAIAQTQEGFLWIGSYSGLVRYDGNNFERVESAKTGITSVISLFVDSKNRLWAGTNDNGVGVLDKGEWQVFNKENGLNSLSVRSIAEDENGLIYLGTTKGVAVVAEDMSISVIQADQIKEAYVRSVMLGRDNIMYALTMEGDIFTMKDGKMTAFYNSEYLGVEDIHAILPDPEVPGYIYFATTKSELYYGPLNQTFRTPYASIEPLAYVNSIHKYEVQITESDG